MRLCSQVAVARSAGDPGIIKRGVLIGIELEHPSTDRDVLLVILRTRVTTD
jgi:hypothetical protein